MREGRLEVNPTSGLQAPNYSCFAISHQKWLNTKSMSVTCEVVTVLLL